MNRDDLHDPLSAGVRSWRRLPWYAAIPGMDWGRRRSWPSRRVANTLCALACTTRLLAKRPQPQSFAGMNSLARDAFHLRSWLREARSDDEAYLWRTTLCEVTAIAPRGTEPKKVLEVAKALAGQPGEGEER